MQHRLPGQDGAACGAASVHPALAPAAAAVAGLLTATRRAAASKAAAAAGPAHSKACISVHIQLCPNERWRQSKRPRRASVGSAREPWHGIVQYRPLPAAPLQELQRWQLAAVGLLVLGIPATPRHPLMQAGHVSTAAARPRATAAAARRHPRSAVVCVPSFSAAQQAGLLLQLGLWQVPQCNGRQAMQQTVHLPCGPPAAIY